MRLYRITLSTGQPVYYWSLRTFDEIQRAMDSARTVSVYPNREEEDEECNTVNVRVSRELILNTRQVLTVEEVTP
jgi:hypothetical protein